MIKIKRKKEDAQWLKALGEHLNQVILKKGYKSPYEFWVEALGEEVSRASLNYILNGRVDVKATTLKKLADALEITPSELLNFKIKYVSGK